MLLSWGLFFLGNFLWTTSAKVSGSIPGHGWGGGGGGGGGGRVTYFFPLSLFFSPMEIQWIWKSTF